MPAARIAETCVLTPSPAIAVARISVSASMAALTKERGNSAIELNPATAMNPKANQGMTPRQD